MPPPDKKKTPKDPGVQGEGDYISGRRYQKDATRFAHEHDTEELAREAAPDSEAEQARNDRGGAQGQGPGEGQEARQP